MEASKLDERGQSQLEILTKTILQEQCKKAKSNALWPVKEIPLPT